MYFILDFMLIVWLKFSESERPTPIEPKGYKYNLSSKNHRAYCVTSNFPVKDISILHHYHQLILELKKKLKIEEKLLIKWLFTGSMLMTWYVMLVFPCS